MIIKNIKLENFRNYEHEIIPLAPKINIFWGANGQGKTNILEGIYYLATGKPYRTQREEELINWNKDNFHLYGDFITTKQLISLESHYQNKVKIIKINKVPCRRLSDYVGIINIVFFSPDDLVMIKGGPSERRRFLDLHIAQLKPGYISLLNSYNQVLQQKNALLKFHFSDSKRVQLQLWNEQLCELGNKILTRRWEYTEQLNDLTGKIYKDISAQKEDLFITYLPLGFKNLEEAKQKYPILLEEKLDHEIERKTASIGPQRDDIQISLHHKSARHFASQGQQRSIVLSLKLAQLEVVKKTKGEYPILLLDDVLSELDNFRRQYLLEFIQATTIQTVLTMTSADNPPLEAELFRVEHGTVRRDK